MKRWDCAKNEYIESAEIDAFLAEIRAACRKHGMSIAHEDEHGAFVIVPYSDECADWLFDAHKGA